MALVTVVAISTIGIVRRPSCSGISLPSLGYSSSGILLSSSWSDVAATSSSSSKTSLVIVGGTLVVAVVVPLAGVLSGADTGIGERVAPISEETMGAEQVDI